MIMVRNALSARLALLLTAMAMCLAPVAAQGQEDARRKATDDMKRAEETRRMSDARRAADRAVDKKAYVNADVSREQLGRLDSPSTPRPPSSTAGGAPAKGLSPK